MTLSETNTAIPAVTSQSPSTFNISNYAFPSSVDTAKHYMFYLHVKTVEDQGIPAVNPTFGLYHYAEILQALSGHGFTVISEQRAKDTDPTTYAKRVVEQIQTLLQAGVPAGNISVVGASKGAGIAIYVSNFLQNPEVNFVIMGICAPDTVKALEQDQVSLSGNVLSIYDAADTTFAGSCQDLFAFSEGKGLSKHDEIVLHIGTGHAVLFQPLDEWVLPTVKWSGKSGLSQSHLIF